MSTHAFAPTFRPFNPFLVQEEPAAPAQAIEGEPCYALVQSGPAVAADEVESHLDAVEVTVRWGTQVLALEHLSQGKGFSLGEGGDFVLPETSVGGKTALVEARGGATYALVPRGAHGVLSGKGMEPVALNGGEEIALGPDTSLTIDLDPVTIEIKTIRAGKKAPVGLLSALASGAAACIGLSFLGHAAIVASMAMFMPHVGADDAEGINRDQILMMQKMLTASAERNVEPPKELPGPSDEAAGGGSTGGEPHKGDSGESGTTRHVTTSGRIAFKGNDDAPALSRKEEKALAENFGIIGLISGGVDKDAPATPWADEAKGTDPLNKMGKMWGTDIDDAAGFGVGLWGTGEGGGGKGAGMGIDGVGSTVGGGGGGPGKWGYGKGDKDGWGNGHGVGKGGYVPKQITIRNPTVESNGRLPAEVIQRIVRQNFGRFRLCYEAGLRNNPGLSGRVVTKFAIDRNGAVSMAQDAGSDMPSQEVTQCIVRSFSALSFPSPEGGIATVTYPIVLSPGE